VTVARLILVFAVGCASPNRRGVPPPAVPDAASTPDTGGADARVSAPTDGPAPAPDGPGAEAQAPVPRPDDGPAPDLATDVPTGCTPGSLGCSDDGRTTRRCDEDGRWVFAQTCGPDDACSAGVCLCGSPRACNDGPLLDEPAGVARLAAGGTRLWYATWDDFGRTLGSIDLVTHARGGISFDSRIHAANAGIAVGATGALFWCRDVQGAPVTGDLLSGNELFEPGPCSDLRVTDSHLYFVSGGILYRRDLVAPGRQLISSAPVAWFEVGVDHAYYALTGTSAGVLRRKPLANPAAADSLVTSRPGVAFGRLALDEAGAFVYIAAGGSLLRTPATGGPSETWWSEADTTTVEAVVTAGAHVYWATSRRSASGCAEAVVWRRPEGGGQAAPAARVAGRCAVDLIRHGQGLFPDGPRLFVALSSVGPTRGPAQILQLRR
jgi:hypothetical protein